MHEYSLVLQMLRRVEEEARARGAVAVRRVALEVGELAGVEPDFLRSAYEVARAGTLCEHAVLEISSCAARWACPRCGRTFARDEVLRCAGCDAPARLDERSEALLLSSIELEVP